MLMAFTQQGIRTWLRRLRFSYNTDGPAIQAVSRACSSLQPSCLSSTVSAALQDLVQTGRLRADDTQRFAARILSAVQSTVHEETKTEARQATDPGAVKEASPSMQHSTVGSKPEPGLEPIGDVPEQRVWPMPRGAYLWGTIGSGKTMLLDMFCTSFCELQQTDLGLCRLHFHEFMLSVHRSLHALQQSVPRIKGKSQFGLPVYRYAVLLLQWCHCVMPINI